jgi:hypothetical protein
MAPQLPSELRANHRGRRMRHLIMRRTSAFVTRGLLDRYGQDEGDDHGLGPPSSSR